MDNEKPFPYEIRDVDPALAAEIMEKFTGEHTGFVHVGPQAYFLPQKYKQEATKIYNMTVRPTDVFVASYPRSGTTWTQELVWMVASGLNYAGSEALPLLPGRYTFLEFSITIHPVMYERFKVENSDSERKLKYLDYVAKPGTEILAETPTTTTRFIVTHLPLSLLPPNLLDTAKMVYVARDPRDIVVSYYHLSRTLRTHGYVGDFKTFWHYFKNNLIHWAPCFEHVKEAWEMRNHPNMLFLFYEELSKDLPAAVRKVAKFFGKEYTEEQVSGLCDHLNFDNFKKNKSVNGDLMGELGNKLVHEQPFIRKGKTGGWVDYFDAELAAELRQWLDHNLRDSDLRFPFMDQ